MATEEILFDKGKHSLTFFKGKLNGSYMYYHLDGKTIQWKGEYYMSNRINLWKFFSINAKLMQEILYIV